MDGGHDKSTKGSERSVTAALRHQRADGAAILTIGCDDVGRSRLRDLYQRAPCRILFPEVEREEPLQAVLLTTTGGLTGGDRTSVEFNVTTGARATLTTQAAEKLYRALPTQSAVSCTVALTAAAGAWAEWLAQETILFNGARLRRSFSADLEAGSRMLAVESVVFGRKAMGEEFRVGLLHDSWRIRRAGRLVWADAMRLEGDIAALRRAPFGFGDAIACTTMLYAGEDAGTLLEPVRALLADAADECGVTLLDELLIIRMLDGDVPRLRSRVISVAGFIRHATAGCSRTLPRVWHC
jgi:urease accessory protein